MPDAGAARLLTVSIGAPHPTRGASAVLFWHYIDAARRAGWRVRHITLGASPEAGAEFVRSIAAPGAFEAECFSAIAPVREGLRGHFIDRGAIGAALARARDFAPDAILAFDLPAAWAFEGVEAPARIVWAGDLMFDVTRHHALYAAREDWRRWPHALLRLVVARNWRPVYARVMGAASGVVASSASSVAKLAELGVRSEFQPYPWPDPGALAERAPPAKPRFVFFGNLAALGSRSALHFTLDAVIPHLRAIWGAGGFEIAFAGTGAPPAWAAAAFARTPEATELGFVPDLGATLARAHAAIAPIDVPVGNRSRILTAMAYRVPVVAHANAALGNPDLVDGETCFLGADAREFAARMRLVVEAPAEAERVAAAGRRAYETNYAPPAACARFVAYLEAFKPANRGARAA
jgi:glycosyltransferase involved in cell wall biosynthesis